jgi:ATP-dependent Clp protease adaptor protein ClpS
MDEGVPGSTGAGEEVLMTEQPNAGPPPTAADVAARPTAPGVKERAALGPVDHLPPYRVLLHNDDRLDMDHVVDTLVQLTPLDLSRAMVVMLEAHKRGVALVLVTHRERAELYVDQFRSKRLTVTIEQAE